jgi:DNA ligase-associated metallophosphoesterase
MIAVEKLQQRLKANQVIPIRFAGHRLLLDASGVLVWPAQDMIIFSDLHLEKGSFLSQFDNPLPRFDSKDTLKRIADMLSIYCCGHVVCLGDSLHDGNALSRMQRTDLETLNIMVQSVERWTWVLGNHDPEIPDIILGERAPHVECESLLLVHEPEDLNDFNKIKAQIIGHYHPKASRKISNRKVTGKCFVAADSLLLMPAFGKYTGGLDLKDEAFDALFDSVAKRNLMTYILFNHRIYMV